jgi:hypothetical protein
LTDFRQDITGLLWLNNDQAIYSKYDEAITKTSFYLIQINNRKEAKLGEWDGRYLEPILFP